jgi:hypothetical protein
VIRNPHLVGRPIVRCVFILIAAVGSDPGETWIFGSLGMFGLWAAARIRCVMTPADVRAFNLFSTRRLRWDEIASLT